MIVIHMYRLHESIPVLANLWTINASIHRLCKIMYVCTSKHSRGRVHINLTKQTSIASAEQNGTVRPSLVPRPIFFLIERS